jgi:hypothetical protein
MLTIQPNERVEAWVPLSFSQDQLQARGNNWVSVVGRLTDGVSFAQAQQAMSTLAHRLAPRSTEICRFIRFGLGRRSSLIRLEIGG